MSDKYKKVEEYFKPKYDSDKDLDEDTQQKIKEQENVFNYSNAEKTRKEAWEKADMYPKLKRIVKGAVYGDKRKSKD
jgi:hypothetical protein